MMSPLAATKAYAAVQKIASDPATTAAAQAPGSSFAELVNNAIGQAVQSSKSAESAMTNHAQGKGDLLDVVTAVSSAQTSLETVMAIRDQVISAYQEILRLQI